MPTPDMLAGLRACPDLAEFSEKELLEIAAISKLVQFDKGHDVFTAEHKDKSIFIVVEGKLSLWLTLEQKPGIFLERQLFGEIILFSDQGRLGVIQCLEEEVILIAIDKDAILIPNSRISNVTRFKLLHTMGKKMASYLYKKGEKSITDLIESAESESIEFKSSTAEVNWDKMVRTVAGFMNLNGGTILCGVKDGGGELAHFKTTRKKVEEFERGFMALVAYHLGVNIPDIRIDFISLGKNDLVTIKVAPASHPVIHREYSKKGEVKESFYIRLGNQNHPILKTSDIVDYIQKRFKFNPQP